MNRLVRPVDNASLCAFRVLFGLMMFGSVIRFAARGWIGEFYVRPKFFFSYYGFEWVRPWTEWGPDWLPYLHFGLLAACALLIALGLFYRAAIAGFFVLFTYAELVDKSLYLNHYYFISVLSFAMLFLPLHRNFSLDARRRPGIRSETAPAFVLGALRLQIGLVYFFAALAKIGPDWLLKGLPLRLWLAANGNFPLLGPLFRMPETAVAMSWAGFLFDLTVPFFLLWRRSRPFAYAAVVVFHLLTWKLFRIGMFPWIMMVATSVFFDPSWPRKWFKLGAAVRPSIETARSSRWILGLLAVHFAVQIALPLRHWLYPGSLLWTEEGFRFSWRVMLMEKNGGVDYTVRDPATGRTWQAKPSDYLEPYQAKAMSTQPDMILQLAHHIAEDFKKRGIADVQVFAEASASLNGRPPARLIDPGTDLARQADGLSPKAWITSRFPETERHGRPGTFPPSP